MNSEKYYVRIIFLVYSMSEKSDMYELIIVFFNNEEPYEFLLFQKNYDMTLDASVTMTSEKINIYARLYVENHYASLKPYFFRLET